LAVTHTAKQHKNVPRYTLLTGSRDPAFKGRVANHWGRTVLSSTSLPAYPDSTQHYLCLGLFEEGPAERFLHLYASNRF